MVNMATSDINKMIPAAFVTPSANYDSTLTVAVEHKKATDDDNNNNVLDNKLFVSEYNFTWRVSRADRDCSTMEG